MIETVSLNIVDTDRIIEMAWEDRTPFDAIKAQFGFTEQQVIKLMRKEMKASSFKRWRERVQGRITKHAQLSESLFRFKCS
ncbi:MAG: TIGR03643 family protein, partial [Ferruginibacter sp.]|nr:TIGR03643 family protein [Ferruginibacter sp.]